MKKTIVVLGLASLVFSASAKIDLGTPFADGAVLQRGMKVPVWGKAAPGCKVTVSFAGNEVSTIACAKGCWKVSLPAMEASKESRTMTVTESKIGWLWDDETDAVEVKDVLVGEVWMCAGQSNTDCPIWGASPRYRDGQGALTLQMTCKPFVRLVKTKYGAGAEPNRDYKAEWLKMTPELFDRYCNNTVHLPSAMGYYYALELANALDIPVGLVDSSVGGTNIDSWTPRSGYAGLSGLDAERDWTFVERQKWTDKCRKGPVSGFHQQPTALWNGMVAAYTPMACRGFIWYQGCHNAGEYQRYCAKMHALYNGWAKEFQNPDLKLYFVQLAPWGNAGIANIQMAQAKFAAEEKNAAMAVINDVGNLTDIHPNDKRTVAKRLAVHALKRDYGWDFLRDNSPTLKSWKVEGDKFILSFNDAQGWYVYNHTMGDQSVGFELAGADGVFKPARLVNVKKVEQRAKLVFKGHVEGKDLVVAADGVAAPKKLRYLASSPWFGSLYNEVSLPLGSFAIGE